jgi:hypothetical protein
MTDTFLPTEWHTPEALIAEFPAWLILWHAGNKIVVYISVNVWLGSDADYAPYRRMLAETGAKLIKSEVVPDRTMMGAQAHMLTYEIER